MYCIPIETALLYTLAAPNCGDVFYSNYDNHIGCTAFSAAAPVVATTLPALLYVSEALGYSGMMRLISLMSAALGGAPHSRLSVGRT